MDFFAHQEQARRKTKVLVFYFGLAVVLMIGAIYVACAFLFPLARAEASAEPVSLWNPQLMLLVAGATLAVIIIGSLIKIAELASGGSAVATALGGRRVNPQTRDPDERKLVNVIEEMAIASGIPVPEIYVMDDELGINAFAAGHSPSDAAIGVTRGAIRLLNRDELQGVMAHEFSHILNGDMRLNLRLIGILFGILCLTIIGRILLRTRGRKNPLPAVGLVLIVFGSIGLLFGRLIKSAVSRQREFLADASAVQFTRLPSGLLGALKKIGGLMRGSRILPASAEEASHLFFGNGLRPSWLNLMSTHPPLEERIRRIDPGFDGALPRITDASFAEQGRTVGVDRQEGERRGIPYEPKPAKARPPRVAVRAEHVFRHVGAPTLAHLTCAAEFNSSLPDPISEAAREPFDASALVFALLLSDDETVRTQQLRELEQHIEPPLFNATVRLFPAVQSLDRAAKLPLVARTLPALRQLPVAHYEAFTLAVKLLIESDQQVDLFEYALQKLLLRHLEPHFKKVPPRVVQYYVLKPVLSECAVLLSALAHVGQGERAKAEQAFALGVRELGTAGSEFSFLNLEECNLPQVDAALDRLAQLTPPLKKQVLNACGQAVAADGLVQEKEAELLRAIADTLDCPVPPFVGGVDAEEEQT